jgi:hypothetical protein
MNPDEEKTSRYVVPPAGPRTAAISNVFRELCGPHRIDRITKSTSPVTNPSLAGKDPLQVSIHDLINYACGAETPEGSVFYQSREEGYPFIPWLVVNTACEIKADIEGKKAVHEFSIDYLYIYLADRFLSKKDMERETRLWLSESKLSHKQEDLKNWATGSQKVYGAVSDDDKYIAVVGCGDMDGDSYKYFYNCACTGFVGTEPNLVVLRPATGEILYPEALRASLSSLKPAAPQWQVRKIGDLFAKPAP